jgi:ribosome maturation factor RimP
MNSTANQLQQSLSPVVTGLGYELLGMEWLNQGKHSLLRIYIDQENGIGIEDCERVSHQLSALLDVEDLIPGHYRLEVSSPGLDRPLFTLEQVQRYVGEQAKVKCHGAIQGQKKFIGTIVTVSLENEEVGLRLKDGELVTIPWNMIAKANLRASI